MALEIRDGIIEPGMFHVFTSEQVEYLEKNGYLSQFPPSAAAEALYAKVAAQHGPGKCKCAENTAS